MLCAECTECSHVDIRVCYGYSRYVSMDINYSIQVYNVATCTVLLYVSNKPVYTLAPQVHCLHGRTEPLQRRRRRRRRGSGVYLLLGGTVQSNLQWICWITSRCNLQARILIRKTFSFCIYTFICDVYQYSAKVTVHKFH